MRLLKMLALVCAAAATQGCVNCYRTTHRVASPDGQYLAWVEVGDGCGGATVGYRTDVMVRTDSRLFAAAREDVLFIKGLVEAEPRWKDAHHLEVTLRSWDDRYDEVRQFIPQWKDVTITYSIAPTPPGEPKPIN